MCDGVGNVVFWAVEGTIEINRALSKTARRYTGREIMMILCGHELVLEVSLWRGDQLEGSG